MGQDRTVVMVHMITARTQFRMVPLARSKMGRMVHTLLEDPRHLIHRRHTTVLMDNTLLLDHRDGRMMST
jgi:hypothetical protein